MASYSSLSDLFTAIADNIRAKLGSSENIVATDFPEKIAEIPSGEPTVSKVLTINRRDSSSAPSNPSVAMYITYPYVSDGAWASVTKTLSNGGSVEIPIPDIQTYSEGRTTTESIFRIFIYTPSNSTRYMINKYDEVPSTVIYREDGFATVSSGEKVVSVDIDASTSELSSGTAVVTLQISGSSS